MMVQIIYIEHDGTEHKTEIDSGSSIMQGAMAHNLNGIIAECGGNCSCATCHIYVHPDWVEKMTALDPNEAAMLEEVCDPRPNSRLSCQIKVNETHEGLVVYLPEKQV